MVRAGRGHLARAGRGLARPHRGASKSLNHWTLVDADGALAAADAIGPGDERPFAGVPIAHQGPLRARRRPADGAGLRPAGRVHARLRLRARAPLPRRGLRDRRQDADARSSGSCRSPSRAASARPATRGTPSAPRAARAAAPAGRWPPARCPSRTPATAAARSASRRPAAASWASSPRAAASRGRPTSATTSSSTDGVVTPHGRGRGGPARPDVRPRAGRRDVGAAAGGAVRRARERATRASCRSRSPSTCRSRASSTRCRAGRARRRGAARGARPRGRGGRRARGRAPTCCRSSPSSGPPTSRPACCTAQIVTGREATGPTSSR